MSEAAVGYAREQGTRFVEELKDLLRIPSVSTAPEHAGDVRKAAEFVADGLRAAGMENVRLIETTSATHEGGHPLVYADWLHASGKPTVLLYGHYDVQPAEPLDEWKSPPFEPTERDGNIYARGAVDDKGQMWMHVKALESAMKADGKLPVNVRVIVEGEEEVGGEGIAAFVREHGDVLKADAALVSDTEMFAPELPTLCVGLRGMIYTELEARGATTDLHSGMYGGAAPNPFVALAQMISQLKKEDGRIDTHPSFATGEVRTRNTLASPGPHPRRLQRPRETAQALHPEPHTPSRLPGRPPLLHGERPAAFAPTAPCRCLCRTPAF